MSRVMMVKGVDSVFQLQSGIESTNSVQIQLFSSCIALLFQFNPSKQIQLDDRYSQVFQQQRCSI
jgi:hypothetical protein